MAISLQNTTTKPRIYVGDTFPIVIEHRLVDTSPTPISATQNRGVPADVDTAVISLWSVASAAYLELGGVGITEVAATITPATSTVGALITYTITPSFTQVAGDYAAFVSFSYDGGQVTTVRQRYKVQAKR